MITEPGTFNMTAAEYHADPCPLPSLSSGIARLMLRSPRHAAHVHPRLNPSYRERAPSEDMVNGTILHRLLLGKGADIEPIPYADFKGSEAKRARQDAVHKGLVPILAHKFLFLKECANAVHAQMREHPACREFFEEGASESVIAWAEGATWLRIMVDRMPTARGAPWFDLKSTGGSAAPEVWQRHLVTTYAFQAAFYTRAGRALPWLNPSEFRFVVFETDPPYAMSVMTAAPSLLHAVEGQVERAIELWRRCMRDQKWPGYPAAMARVEAPNWLLAQEEERAFNVEQIEEIAA